MFKSKEQAARAAARGLTRDAALAELRSLSAAWAEVPLAEKEEYARDARSQYVQRVSEAEADREDRETRHVSEEARLRETFLGKSSKDTPFTVEAFEHAVLQALGLTSLPGNRHFGERLRDLLEKDLLIDSDTIDAEVVTRRCRTRDDWCWTPLLHF